MVGKNFGSKILKDSAGVCFYFEDHDVDVYSGRRIDLDAWNYAAQAGGPDVRNLLVLNRTDKKLTTPNAHMRLEVLDGNKPFPNLDGSAAYFIPPSDDRWQTTLWDFDHNVDWYCFGPAMEFEFEPRKNDIIVTIPMDVQLHAVHAASVVMAHRYAVLNNKI